MALRADPPDFIDSGSDSVRNVSGWAGRYANLAIGTTFAVLAIGAGVGGASMIRRRVNSSASGEPVSEMV